jgi:predicted nucleic acid-binding protein
VASVIVLDASVLIAWLDGKDAHHVRAETLLTAETDDDLATSSVTLAEVLVVPARTGQLPAVQAALAELGVEELPFPADAAARLAQLRAATDRKTPDCCVLLAAEDAGARMASFDKGLLRAAADRGIGTLPD